MSKKRPKKSDSGSTWKFDDGTLAQRWQAVREELSEQEVVDPCQSLDSIPQNREKQPPDEKSIGHVASVQPGSPQSLVSAGLTHRFSAPIRKKSDRKAMQLCRQVLRAVEHALGSRPLVDQLPDCVVVAVLPAPHTAQLLVQVAVPPMQALDHAEELLAVLRDANGSIRSEVARSIHRRKTPSLLFQIVPQLSPQMPSSSLPNW